MQTLRRGGFSSALLLALPLIAHANGPALNGTVRIGAEETRTTIRYNVEGTGSAARGEVTLTGKTLVSDEQEPTGELIETAFTVQASFDCVRISGTHATMSGFITSSTLPEHIGSKVLLAVRSIREGRDPSSREQVTWGIYKPRYEQQWIASDAELPNDRGSSYRWLATDAERLDDRGIPSSHSDAVDCHTFSFDSFEFVATQQ